MSASLPYLVSATSLKNALERIRTAATPERVTGDFVNAKLQLKGGSGSVMPPFLKKIGLVASDGTPTDLYKKFRNVASSGAAIAEAVKIGYKELALANEYFYDLSDKELLALILQVTGAAADSDPAKLTLRTIKTLKSFADFDSKVQPESTMTFMPDSSTATQNQSGQNAISTTSRVGLNLSYTINLNLPATSEQAVFNAIFRSLKEHLLSTDE
jgi:Family of unknown function (DUF5343)